MLIVKAALASMRGFVARNRDAIVIVAAVVLAILADAAGMIVWAVVTD